MKKILLTLFALTLPLFGQVEDRGYFKIEKVLDVGIIAQEFSTKPKHNIPPDTSYGTRSSVMFRRKDSGNGPTNKVKDEQPIHTLGFKKYYIPNLRIRRDYKFEAIYENTGKKVQHNGVTYEVLIVKRYVDFKYPKK